MTTPHQPRTLLHLACGSTVLPLALQGPTWQVLGWDESPQTKPKHVGGLPVLHGLADVTVDAVYASHQLPRLALPQVVQALAECWRVLRPGGTAWFVVPDLQALAPYLAQGDLHSELFSTAEGPVTAARLVWGGAASASALAADAKEAMGYRSGFVASSMQRLLQQAGFENVAIQRDAARFEMMASAQKPRATNSAVDTSATKTAHNANAASSLFERGRQLHAAGQWAQAEDLYQQALQLNPALWPARYEWGVACYAQGRISDAIQHVRQALAAEPRFARAHAALGSFLGLAGQPSEAVKHLQRAAELEPASAESRYNLGKAWQDLNALSAAEDAYRHALRLDAQHALSQLNLGKVLNEQGQTQEGLALYRSAAQQLQEPRLRSSLPMLMNFVDSATDDQVFAAHTDFDRHFAAPLRPAARPRPLDPQPQRRLRLGYLSRDLRQHSMRYFLLPVLAHHNHQQFEVVAYCDNEQVDAVTQLYRPLCDTWVESHSLDDAALAQRIRDDRIDILFDLAGHTDRNRLMVFARQPAPVQVSYLGYPATTGLQAMDYRISDRWIDPEPSASAAASAIAGPATSETPLRLNHGYFCYAPMADSPAVAPCPFERQGCITFGSLNQGSKLTPLLLAQWVKLLQRLPDARLCLQNAALHEKRAQDRLLTVFKAQGIAAHRLTFRPFAAAPGYLQTYHDIDIALDSYPYNGGTTTCEALWMGVPVVTWCGTRHVSRLGASVLHALQLGDLVAHTPQDYVQKALDLAASPERLRSLRAGLRGRMQASPLMDHAGFTRELEGALRTAWQRACSTQAV